MRLRNDVEKWRKLRRLTRAQLARRAGVSSVTIWKIERRYGDYGTTHEVIERLSRALGVDKAALFWAEEEVAPGNGRATKSRKTAVLAG